MAENLVIDQRADISGQLRFPLFEEEQRPESSMRSMGYPSHTTAMVNAVQHAGGEMHV